MTNPIYKIKDSARSLIISLFNCLPIKKNKLFFYSYYGSQYGCNPKYLSEWIIKNDSHNDFDIVWAFNDVDSKSKIKGIRPVKVMSLKYFYELCTAKVIVTNFRTTDQFKKRKNQYYIQTWHSSLRLKQIEKDVESSLPIHYVQMAKKDSPKCDLLLSGCKFSTDIFKRAFWYEGEILEAGTPRNDLFFSENTALVEKVKSQLKIKSHQRIVLYAPTFRKHDDLSVYQLDFDAIKNQLTQSYGGEWIFLVKLHPHLMNKSKEITNGSQVMDVTQYDDIQELLLISDVLISDYSSLMFDFTLTKRPCFLFVPDLEEYTKTDRSLYFKVEELPFSLAKTNKELLNQINSHDEIEYTKKVEHFLSEIGSFETGNCCEELNEIIRKVCLLRGNRSEKI